MVEVINKIDANWIQVKMFNTATRVKHISADLGIEKSSISAWINGKKPMSKLVKAMFYYYFMNVEFKRLIYGM